MDCPCCGSLEMRQKPVLWPQLITDWRLAEHEVTYINWQQGLFCVACGSNLRSMVLAKSIMTCYGFTGYLKQFVHTDIAKSLHILEINEAFTLTQFFKV